MEIENPYLSENSESTNESKKKKNVMTILLVFSDYKRIVHYVDASFRKKENYHDVFAGCGCQ